MYVKRAPYKGENILKVKLLNTNKRRSGVGKWLM
jgi:hypothetical protein